MPKLDLNRLHNPHKYGRGAGRTTTAICDAIGKVMVLDSMMYTAFLIVRDNSRIPFVTFMIEDICCNHFQVKLRRKYNNFFIDGYRTGIRIVSLSQWSELERYIHVEPTYDLD